MSIPSKCLTFKAEHLWILKIDKADKGKDLKRVSKRRYAWVEQYSYLEKNIKKNYVRKSV